MPTFFVHHQTTPVGRVSGNLLLRRPLVTVSASLHGRGDEARRGGNKDKMSFPLPHVMLRANFAVGVASPPPSSLPSAPSPSPAKQQLDGREGEALTVYSIRMKTGLGGLGLGRSHEARGPALSNPYSAVNVCLVGKDGRCSMRRISPVNDPKESIELVERVCKVVGNDAGANCLNAASLANDLPRPARPRFTEGAVDEVGELTLPGVKNRCCHHPPTCLQPCSSLTACSLYLQYCTYCLYFPIQY